jgi:multiple sugar transport system ATP-binding protein
MAEIRLQGVRKSFAHQEVIAGIDLEIGDGEFCVFLGPSGCGKSTLLRLIAGLEGVSHGRIYIGGRDVTRLPPKQRDLAMVFQSYALYPHMTVFENMAFGLRLAQRKRGEIAQRVERAARTLHIEHLLARKPSQLSGGQRQRVAIGRGIVREPRVFLLDEPLSNLDADLRVYMRLELSRLHRRLGTTMVHVTHDQLEAMTLADRLVLMHEGRVAQRGPPLELYHRPCNLYVARFLGSPPMNFLPGRLKKTDDIETLVELSDGTCLRAAIDSGAASAGDTVTLGIRPEQVRLNDHRNCLQARVVQVEHLGDHGLIYLEHDGGNRPVVVRCGADVQTGMGAQLKIGLPPQDCHLFDQNGRAFSRAMGKGMGDNGLNSRIA